MVALLKLSTARRQSKIAASAISTSLATIFQVLYIVHGSILVLSTFGQNFTAAAGKGSENVLDRSSEEHKTESRGSTQPTCGNVEHWFAY